MEDYFEDSPILNSAYHEPEYHYATASDGSLDYQNVKGGRRIFTSEIQVIPEKQKGQKEAFDVNEAAFDYDYHLINLIREEINKWRNEEYPSVTKVTKELLEFWFLNPERHETKQMFLPSGRLWKQQYGLMK